MNISTEVTLVDCEKSKSLWGWDIDTNAIYLSPSKAALDAHSNCMQIPTIENGAKVKVAKCKDAEQRQQWTASAGPDIRPNKNETFVFKTGVHHPCPGIVPCWECLTMVSSGGHIKNGDPVYVSSQNP